MDEGRIKGEVAVSFARPRNQETVVESRAYQELKDKLLSLFYESGKAYAEEEPGYEEAANMGY